MRRNEEIELDESLGYMREQFRTLTDGIPIPGSLQADLLKKRLEQMEAELEEQELEEVQNKKVLHFPTKAIISTAACLAIVSVSMLSYHMGQRSQGQLIESPAVSSSTAHATEGSALDTPQIATADAAPSPMSAEPPAPAMAPAMVENNDASPEIAAFGAPVPPQSKERGMLDMAGNSAPVPVGDTIADVWQVYLPQTVPQGLTPQSTIQNGNTLMVSYLNEDYSRQVQLLLRTVDEQDYHRQVEQDQPETYDLRMYEQPYADTVPEGLASTVNNPVFLWEDLSPDMIRSRVFDVNGVEGQEQGNFSVLFPTGIVAEINVTGVSSKEIFTMLQGMYV